MVSSNCGYPPLPRREPMKIFRGRLPFLALLLAASVIACAPVDDPEIVAISYVRASNEGDPETAVRLLDLERIANRVEEQIVVVDSSGRESFLEDSIESLLWGLFYEQRATDFAYNAPPAAVDGDTARVVVTKTPRDGDPEEITVHLRRTSRGWRVSGSNLDRLVTFVVQRLEEKY